jgi:hypothetical protein
MSEQDFAITRELDAAERNGAPQGWRETFDKLESYLSELQCGSEIVH